MNFEKASQTYIAFVGTSGSGKSTIMNMIIGFSQADGSHRVHGGRPHCRMRNI
ncbi:MAG: ATP-binding cassette domain-containing protein [Oscillospiraceae bacterium]|nr:ATP-binding cassette domain-containing protein [Oscillospiraceae bacterium]